MDTCICKAESLCCPPESISVVNRLFAVVVQSLSRVRLCDLMDCSLPGSSVHGISQARILEWDAILSSREPS